MTTRGAGDAQRPNILFFLPDQHRPDWTGANPALPLRLPQLDALAARGVRFTQAVTPSPLCAPARACLASGRDYAGCGVADNGDDYPVQQPTYYQALRDGGYRVAGVGKFDLHKATMDWGLDGSRLIDTWGFTEGIDNEGKMDAIASGAAAPKGPYMAYLWQRGLAAAHVADFRARRNRGTDPTPLPEEAYCDNWIAENGLRFLRDFPRQQPWHLVVNFTGPHSPFDVTASMRARWADAGFPAPVDNTQDLAADEHQAIRQNYAAMLENIDRQIGRFLEVVAERGELERTLVVYSSDHGEMLGDHSRWGKSTYYQASAGVPLVVAGPGVQRGVTSGALVSMHDLAATFLELAGRPALPEMESRSLAPLLRGERAAHREVVRSGLNNWRMVSDGRYKLVHDQREDGRTEVILFDRQQDPLERTNAAPSAPAEVARLTPLL